MPTTPRLLRRWRNDSEPNERDQTTVVPTAFWTHLERDVLRPLGWTPTHLADATGISRSTVVKWHTSRTVPSERVCAKLAAHPALRAIGVTKGLLLYWAGHLDRADLSVAVAPRTGLPDIQAQTPTGTVASLPRPASEDFGDEAVLARVREGLQFLGQGGGVLGPAGAQNVINILNGYVAAHRALHGLAADSDPESIRVSDND